MSLFSYLANLNLKIIQSIGQLYFILFFLFVDCGFKQVK